MQKTLLIKAIELDPKSAPAYINLVTTLPQGEKATGNEEEMTSQSYIVPGLGDAGDLSFGEKI